MNQESVQIDPDMVTWYKGMLAESPVRTDGSSADEAPSPDQMLDDIIAISKTGKIETESQRFSYNAVKAGYDDHLARQEHQ